MSAAETLAAELKARADDRSYIGVVGGLLAEKVALRHYPDLSHHDGEVEGALMAKVWAGDLDRTRRVLPDAQETVARIAVENDAVAIETVTTATLPDSGPVRVTLKRVLHLKDGRVVGVDQYEDGQSHRLRAALAAGGREPTVLRSS